MSTAMTLRAKSWAEPRKNRARSERHAVRKTPFTGPKACKQCGGGGATKDYYGQEYPCPACFDVTYG